jgi:hypothetical protein
VVLEPSERRAYTLVQQLNTLRNAKLKKRQEMQARRRVAHDKNGDYESIFRNRPRYLHPARADREMSRDKPYLDRCVKMVTSLPSRTQGAINKVEPR